MTYQILILVFTLQRYSFVIESKAFVYRFARALSNFFQKQGCVITKNDFA